MDIRTLLKVMVDQEASDMYLTVDSPPAYRSHGATQPANTPPSGIWAISGAAGRSCRACLRCG